MKSLQMTEARFGFLVGPLSSWLILQLGQLQGEIAASTVSSSHCQLYTRALNISWSSPLWRFPSHRIRWTDTVPAQRK